MANSSLNVSSLDFDVLKANFITFLKTQTAFKDYNFEGSNMNVLLDVLSYNSYLNSFYLNMVASEMFLDTAQKLDSVISHAKELNYTPRSVRSAKAVVSFNLQTTGIENPLILPKGTLFSGTNSNGTFSFVTNQENSYLSTNSLYSIANLEIYEGFYSRDTFVVDYSLENQTFVLSNKNVDTTSITIAVSEDNGVSNTYFKMAENLYNLNSNSEIYFLQATLDQKFEIVFGDNIFGKKPKNSSVVYVNYRVSSGSDGNGITNFSLDQDIGAYNGGFALLANNIQAISASVSGANLESLESIKYNAPRHYQTQNRCITSEDYISTILQNFPEVQYVNVFGGSITNTAVEFGKVYISPSTYDGNLLTDSRKEDIQNYVNKICPIGIVTKVINPDYLYLDLHSSVSVNFSNTEISASTLRSNIISDIKQFNVDNLQNFKTTFRLSKLEQTINEADVGILSNQTKTRLYKQFSPRLNFNSSINCEFHNQLLKGSIISTEFNSLGKIYVFTDNIQNMENRNNDIFLLEINNSTIKNYNKIGTVDYNAGSIKINQLVYSDIGGGIKIYANAVSRDVKCVDNTILSIDTVSGINVTIVSE